ncbi:hypothetical protein pdam_00018882 [Pocillopora damicornis]|uniref:BRICHOS domain-containing protein n=1 Tax=Pocillopora damicornis TaxID=46731 RepID=A0A3M6UHE0_POCDA|nr:hypothetical protein pdam_00018882 [Pocillopora damicornis]
MVYTQYIRTSASSVPVMAYLFSFLIVFVVLGLSSASPTNIERRMKKQVVDFNLDIIEGGIGYTEKIEVDLEKQTELFQVPTHPGVDRSDVLHDFKNNLTMLRFPKSKICYLFPLVKRQSRPEKLIRDHKRAQKYTIYHVTEERKHVAEEQTEGETSPNRVRRQSESGLNDTKLCPGGLDLNSALQVCSEPKIECDQTLMCFEISRCNDFWRRRRSLPFWLSYGGCWYDHDTRNIVECCSYVCNDIDEPTTGTVENMGSEMVVTETKRVDNTWILDGQLTDRSTLSEELAQFCAKYFIYHVKKTHDSLKSHTIQKRRIRRINRLCPGGMDLDDAFNSCYPPKFRCRVRTRTCYKYVICTNVGEDRQDNWIDVRFPRAAPLSLNCREEHIWNAIVCCEYTCMHK